MYSLAEARDPVHTALLKCVRECFREFDFLKRDIARGKKTKPILCC